MTWILFYLMIGAMINYYLSSMFERDLSGLGLPEETVKKLSFWNIFVVSLTWPLFIIVMIMGVKPK